MSKKTAFYRFWKKHAELGNILKQIGEVQGLHFCIHDRADTLLYEFNPNGLELKYVRKILFEGEILAKIKSNQSAEVITSIILTQWKQLVERKRIGAEALDLYREINFIYNFSEALSNASGSKQIAQIAIQQASQLIKFSEGMLFLFSETYPDQLDWVEYLGQSRDWMPTDFLATPAVADIVRKKKGILINGMSLTLSGNESLNALIYTPLRLKDRYIGGIIGLRNPSHSFVANDLKLLSTLALQTAAAIDSSVLFEKRILEVQEREEAIRRIHEVTTRFVPYEFLTALGRDKLTDLVLGDQVQRVVTVFFSDIRGYTTIAEEMSPEENFQFVYAFNQRIGPLIKHNRGFVNQYLGDGIMAIFPQTPKDALDAALGMQSRLKAYNAERVLHNRLPIDLGMGLHTGPLVMGIIGDEERMDPATISDTVNTAARLEGLSKRFGAKILISGDTLLGIENPDKYNFRYLGEVHVKGKKMPIKVYECLDAESDDVGQLKLITLSQFQLGMKYLHAGEYQSSLNTFKAIQAINPNDKAVMDMIRQVKLSLDHGDAGSAAMTGE